MSRIPVPSSSPSQPRSVSVSSPVPFPGERASSPLPGSRHNTTHTSMSSLSGFQSETRKKTSKRDEVRLELCALIFQHSLALAELPCSRPSVKRLNPSFPENVQFLLLKLSSVDVVIKHLLRRELLLP